MYTSEGVPSKNTFFVNVKVIFFLFSFQDDLLTDFVKCSLARCCPKTVSNLAKLQLVILNVKPDDVLNTYEIKNKLGHVQAHTNYSMVSVGLYYKTF